MSDQRPENSNSENGSKKKKTSGAIKLSQLELDSIVDLHIKFIEGRMGGRRANCRNMDLSGLSLVNKNLQQADFTGCIMQNMDLTGTNFREASLYVADLRNSNLNYANFIRADLRGARIENSNLEGADLEAADLRGGGITSDEVYGETRHVNFRGANLSGARLVGTMASNADFSDAILSNADISRSDLRNASFSGADLSNAELSGCTISGADLQSAVMVGIKFDEFVRAQVDTRNSITEANVGISLSELEHPLAHLIEVHRLWVKTVGAEGRQLDLSGYDLRELDELIEEKLTGIKACHTRFFGMSLYRIELQSAILDGSDFQQCDLEGADLRGSSFKGAIFNHANMRGVNFNPLIFGKKDTDSYREQYCDLEGAYFRYVDLLDSKLRGANLRGADLSYTNLTKCDLRDADLTGAYIENIVLNNAKLNGTIFDETQREYLESQNITINS